MLSLKQALEDEIEIDGKKYILDLSFDNVLRWYELMEDSTVNEEGKIEIAFMMFIQNFDNSPITEEISFEVKITTIQQLSIYISGKSDDEDEDDDGVYEAQKEYFNFDQDANYIFASFLQEYGIDLTKEFGKLRWEKFIALLNGLRNDTKFNEIVGIRCAELPTGSDEHSIAEKQRMMKLKSMYELKSQKNVQYMESQMDSLFRIIEETATKKGG